jgi:hypothetical protein
MFRLFAKGIEKRRQVFELVENGQSDVNLRIRSHETKIL